MPASPVTSAARATVRVEDGVHVIALAGRWRITEPRPEWAPPTDPKPSKLRIEMDQVEAWDSAIVLFAFTLSRWARSAGVELDTTALNPAVRDLLQKMEGARETCVPLDRSQDFLTFVGLTASDLWTKKKEITHFVGECVISAVYLAKHPHRFRWRDCLYEMQACGAMALPIVSLIGFLVGLTLAYTGAVVLRQFGADIWVADLVGLTMAREMGAVMTAIVLAGRTGAAYAATLGNMRANEEIDALETLGIRPVDFLVMPRIAALGVMMPLLALYANALGILGGMAVAAAVLDIPPTAYWIEMLTIVDLSDVSTGLIKAFTFGIIVGIAGCMRGMQAQRSAAGVGLAATSAVVTAILFIIVADALYAVIFNILGW
ncbi:ABC transporter permease [Opitutaceae bacterium]